jgi:DNA repair protein RadC
LLGGGNVKLILHINHEDVAVTRQLVAAGTLLDIEVLDHLIVGQQRYVSLRERGLGFE